jgi:hypothetical protein
VCGPWEIVKTAGIDESPPVWFIACEIDYLGRMVDPGQRIEDNLTLQLEPGSYLVQVDVFWECVLGEPKRISPTETYYGEFRDCAGRSQILSAPFEVR